MVGDRSRAATNRAYDVCPAWMHSRVALAEDNPQRDLTLLGAFEGTAMVGIRVCQLPLLDNTHLAFVDIGVPPAHRGREPGSPWRTATRWPTSRASRSSTWP